MDNPGSLLEDNAGGLSAIRFSLLLWVIGVLSIWVWLTISTGQMVPIDQSVITVLGILAGTKAIQRFGENAPADTATPPIQKPPVQ